MLINILGQSLPGFCALFATYRLMATQNRDSKVISQNSESRIDYLGSNSISIIYCVLHQVSQTSEPTTDNNNNTTIIITIWYLVGLNGIIFIKHLEECLVHSSHSAVVS